MYFVLYMPFEHHMLRQHWLVLQDLSVSGHQYTPYCLIPSPVVKLLKSSIRQIWLYRFQVMAAIALQRAVPVNRFGVCDDCVLRCSSKIQRRYHHANICPVTDNVTRIAI